MCISQCVCIYCFLCVFNTYISLICVTRLLLHHRMISTHFRLRRCGNAINRWMALPITKGQLLGLNECLYSVQQDSTAYLFITCEGKLKCAALWICNEDFQVCHKIWNKRSFVNDWIISTYFSMCMCAGSFPYRGVMTYSRYCILLVNNKMAMTIPDHANLGAVQYCKTDCRHI